MLTEIDYLKIDRCFVLYQCHCYGVAQKHHWIPQKKKRKRKKKKRTIVCFLRETEKIFYFSLSRPSEQVKFSCFCELAIFVDKTIHIHFRFSVFCCNYSLEGWALNEGNITKENGEENMKRSR